MFSSENWFGASPSFYNGVATTSYRNEPAVVLTKEQDAPTSSKIMSMGGWIKRNKVGHYSNVFSGALGGSGVPQAFMYIDNTNNRLEVLCYSGSAYVFRYMVSRKFRDTSAWYHLWLQIDSTEGNNATADRVKIYVNGVRETTYDDTPTHIADGTPDIRAFNEDGIKQYFGHTNASYGGHLYYSDWYFIDGLAISPVDTVGEFKNGVFIPKAYTPTEFGNNGFHLKFDQTGVGTPSATTIGADSSGKANHFTSTEGTNVEAHDCAMPDSPENNFPTWNPLAPDPTYGITTISEGNLKSQNTPNNNKYSEITFYLDETNKYYFEYYNITTTGALQPASFEIIASSTNKVGFYITTAGYISVDGSSIGTGFPTLSAGDIVNIAFDGASGKVWFGKNGTYYNASGSATGNPADGSNPIATLTSAEFKMTSTFYQQGAIMNFGQDSTFAGNKTSGSENAQDSNGIGDFYDTVPSGFLALCSANLPEPTISPNVDTQADDYFNTVLYTGTGNNTQDITGVGFQPDWVWIKNRGSGYSHQLQDSNRGMVATKVLSTNQTAGEGVASATGDNYGHISAVSADGFTLTHTINANNDGGTIRKGTHFLNDTYVAWNWKAGGTTPTKTYKVVVVSDSGNKYRFRNSADSATFAQSAVALNLQEGGTYTFDYSDSTATSHPFRFSTTSDGTHGGGSEYTTGVVKDDTAKTITITVASSAPTLYYYCSAHSGMGGQVNTNTTFGSTNFDGSILSVSQPNTTAGFSIVTATSPSSGTWSLGHGLSKKPDMIIQKYRSGTSRWTTWHNILTSGQYLGLNETSDIASSGTPFNFTITDSVIGGNADYDNTSQTVVYYVFHNVEGYSRFGNYSGNADPDGTFVYLGFRPAWLMVKSYSSAGDSWFIFDNKRTTANVMGKYQRAEAPTVEQSDTAMDFVSNGFKLRSTSGAFNDATNFIYMAFAEAPFKYANAR